MMRQMLIIFMIIIERIFKIYNIFIKGGSIIDYKSYIIIFKD